MTAKLIALTSLIFSTPAFACEDGFEAFKKTVFVKARTSCAKCHDGSNAEAPPFATDDAFASYSQLTSYVNFLNVDESLLVIRAGNGHCGISNCQAESGKEMSAMVSAWWAGGEKSCETNGHYFSPEVDLPPVLPKPNEGFATLSFDLSKIKADLNGVKLEIDVQNYMDKSTISKGILLFRSPRLVGGRGNAYVKNLKVLLNGRYDSIYNAFTTVDRKFPFVEVKDSRGTATPTLSAATLQIIKDGVEDSKVMVSFVDVGVDGGQSLCVNQAELSKSVMPAVNSLNCVQCHDGRSTGTVGEKVLNFNSPIKQICGVTTSMIDPTFVYSSALFQIPMKGAFNHPMLNDDQREQYTTALKAWLKLE